MPRSLRYDIFGRQAAIECCKGGWRVYWVSGDGKKRPVDDLIIPSTLSENEIEQFLADLFHEFATEKNSLVRKIPTLPDET